MFNKTKYDETAESCIEILSGTHPTHKYSGEGTDNSDKISEAFHLLIGNTN